MSTNNTALQLAGEARPAITINDGALELTSIESLFRYAQFIAASPFAPKDYKSPEAIVVAITYGWELGLSPMQALQNVAVINGKPSIYGDAAKALCEASGLMEDFDEYLENEDDIRKLTAVCMSKRVGRKPLITRFSWEDALTAGLPGRSSTWAQYPKRMLKWRARGFNLRDNFPDVLKGLILREEAQDMAPDNEPSPDGTPRQPKSRLDAIKERLAGSQKPSLAEAANEAIVSPERNGIFDEPDAIDAEIDFDAAADLGVVIDSKEPAGDTAAQDEQPKDAKKTSPRGLEILKVRMEAWTEADRDAFLDAFSIGRLEDLPPSVYLEAMGWIDERNAAPDNVHDDEPPFESAAESISAEQMAELGAECEKRKLSDTQISDLCAWLDVDSFAGIPTAKLARARKLIVIAQLLAYTGASLDVALKHYRVGRVAGLTDDQITAIQVNLQRRAAEKSNPFAS